eukprot:jgi/Galph1/3339/GphlegSOOS_G1963.1
MSQVDQSEGDNISKKRKTTASSEKQDRHEAGGSETCVSPSTPLPSSLRSRVSNKQLERNTQGRLLQNVKTESPSDLARGNSMLERSRQRVLERLKDIRRRAVASRDEHKRQLLVIERQVSASAAALLRAKTMREAKKRPSGNESAETKVNDSYFFQTDNTKRQQFPVSFSPAPALPALFIFGQSDPPETLSLEDSIIRNATEIIKKNTSLAKVRLPKQPEPPRAKVSWDYVLEEMVWLSVDFREERKWKICVARQLSREALVYRERLLCQRDSVERGRRERANRISDHVRCFWSEVKFLHMYRERLFTKPIIELQNQKALEELVKANDYSEEVPSEWNESVPISEMENESSHEKNSEFEPPLKSVSSPTEDQREEQLTALFDTVSDSVSSADPVVYFVNNMNSDSSLKKSCIDESQGGTLEGNHTAYSSPDFIVQSHGEDFGILRRNVEKFLDKLLNEVRNVDIDLSKERESLPLFRGSLKECQNEDLRWLIKLYDMNQHGILTGERGLGKKVTAISFLSWLAGKRSIYSRHLIITSKSLTYYWSMELKKWFPLSHPSVLDDTVKEITSLDTVVSELQSLEKHQICICSYKWATEHYELLNKANWHCLLLDDAKYSTLVSSSSWKSLLDVPHRFRFLITEDYSEKSFSLLWRLLHFVTFKSFMTEMSAWDVGALEHVSERYLQDVLKKLQRIMSHFVRRRTKRLVLHEFPEKLEDFISCSLSHSQYKLYNYILSKINVADLLSFGSTATIYHFLKTLRNVCNHTNLVDLNFATASFVQSSIELHLPKALKFIEHYRTLDENEDFLTRQSFHMLHSDANLVISKELRKFYCGHVSSEESENFISGEEVWQRSLKFLVNDESKKTLAGLNAQSKNEISFVSNSVDIVFAMRARNLRVPVFGPDLRNMFSICKQPLNMSLEKEAQQISCYPMLQSVCSRQKQHMEKICERLEFCVTRAVANTPQMYCTNTLHVSESESLSVTKEFLASLKTDKEHAHRFVEVPRPLELDINSRKLAALKFLLHVLYSKDKRCVILTESTEMLEILERFLDILRYSHLRIDGSLSVAARLGIANKFNQTSSIFCCIVQFATVFAGLFLSEADVLIYFDHPWDFDQVLNAQDVIYNIGQTRNVAIFHLFCKDTVEEIMLKEEVRRNVLKLASPASEDTDVSLKDRRTLAEIINLSFDWRSSGLGYIEDQPKSGSDIVCNDYDYSIRESETSNNYYESLVSHSSQHNSLQYYARDSFDIFIDETTIFDEKEIDEDISPLKRYAISLFDRMQQHEEEYIYYEVDASRASAGHNTDESEWPIVDPVLCYSRMRTDESMNMYHKTVWEPDSELKIFKPLHDSGPEELSMSVVVDKTAATGIESAEDAAFFPYAYSRLSGTSHMTSMQRSKMMSNATKEEGNSSSLDKDLDSWEQGTQNRIGGDSKSGNRYKHNNESAASKRKTRVDFLDGSEDKFLSWTDKENRILDKLVDTCDNNYVICCSWLLWTSRSCTRLRKPRTENECKVRYESIKANAKDPVSSQSSADSVFTSETSLLKTHVSRMLTIIQKKLTSSKLKGETNDFTSIGAPHPSHTRLIKSLLGEKTESRVMPHQIPKPKVYTEEWKPGYKPNDPQLQQPFIRRTSSVFSRSRSQSSINVPSRQGALQHFVGESVPQRVLNYARNLTKVQTQKPTLSVPESGGQMLNARSLSQGTSGALMRASNLSLRPTILTKLMKKQQDHSDRNQQFRNFSFESGCSQSEGRPTTRYLPLYEQNRGVEKGPSTLFNNDSSGSSPSRSFSGAERKRPSQTESMETYSRNHKLARTDRKASLSRKVFPR